MLKVSDIPAPTEVSHVAKCAKLLYAHEPLQAAGGGTRPHGLPGRSVAVAAAFQACNLRSGGPCQAQLDMGDASVLLSVMMTRPVLLWIVKSRGPKTHSRTIYSKALVTLSTPLVESKLLKRQARALVATCARSCFGGEASGGKS